MRAVMEMYKNIAVREHGQGLKLVKFHASMHVPDDILLHGPPSGVNTDTNESHHIRDKGLTEATQKRIVEFVLQVCDRIWDMSMLEDGMMESLGKRRWEYFEGFPITDPWDEAMDLEEPVSTEDEEAEGEEAEDYRESDEAHASDAEEVEEENGTREVEHETSNMEGEGGTKGDKEPRVSRVGGVRTQFWFDEDGKEQFSVKSKMKLVKQYRYRQDVACEIYSLLKGFGSSTHHLTVFSELQLDGNTFRAQPICETHSWHDWATAYNMPQPAADDLETIRTVMACEICAFVDLREMPESAAEVFLSGEPMARRVYALVEFAALRNRIVAEKISKSDIFLPVYKQRLNTPGQPAFKKQWIPIDWIVDKCCVIENYGSENQGAYYRTIPRVKWATMFQNWIMHKHEEEYDEPEIGE